MSSSGFRPFRPAPDRTTARVLDPTRVFPGPGTGSGAAPDAEEPTAVRPRVIAGEIVRRRHRATRVRRRSPGVMGAAVLSATGAIVTLTLVVSQQSSHGPSGAGRHPVTSALGRPAEPRALPASPARRMAASISPDAFASSRNRLTMSRAAALPLGTAIAC